MSDATNASSTEQSEGVAGVGMFVAAYVDERAAEQVLENMKQAKKSGELYYEDAAVIRQDTSGKVHIKETGDMSTGKGAGVGALVGGVIGLLGGPAGVALGAGAGAAVGGLAAHHDAGFSQESLKEIGGALLPGTSALAATTSQAFVEAVRKQVSTGDTLTMARDLATEIQDRLQARQDTLIGLVITEQGIAATQIVSSPSELAVFGIAADESGVVAGQAVATDAGVAYEVAAADDKEAAYEAGVVTDEGAAVVDAYASADDEQQATTDDEGADEQSS